MSFSTNGLRKGRELAIAIRACIWWTWRRLLSDQAVDLASCFTWNQWTWRRVFGASQFHFKLTLLAAIRRNPTLQSLNHYERQSICYQSYIEAK